LQATYRYEIPAFRNASGFLHQALGNWEFGGVSTFQSGLPVNFSCASCLGNVFGLPTSTLFPQVVGNLNQLRNPGDPQQSTGSSAYNTSVLGATTLNPAGTIVSGLNVFGGPGSESFMIGGPGTGSHVGSFFGNLGRNVPQGRAPRQQQWEFYLAKSIPIHESVRMQFRTEFFNVFNHPNFAVTNFSVGTASFGIFDTPVGNPRIIQFALKLQY